MEYITLANGYQLPMLGYGTLHIPPKQTKECVLKAFEAGYRLIDTAASYQNEKEIGEAIKESKLKREEIYLTTKVWVQDAGYENTLQAFHQSLENLGVDYLGWPQPWPIPGRASYSHRSPRLGPPSPFFHTALKAVSSPPTPRVTANPWASSQSVKRPLAKTS